MEIGRIWIAESGKAFKNKVTLLVHVTTSGVTHHRSNCSFKLIIANYSVSCYSIKVRAEGQGWQYGHHAEEITAKSMLLLAWRSTELT
jgi:hypothetical protein